MKTQLIPLTVKTQCDNGRCRNRAEYIVAREDTPVYMQLHLCGECLKTIAALAKETQAKSSPPSNKTKKGEENVGADSGSRR